MIIGKSKPMGFRNSGKFDISGKGGKFVIIGGVVIVVILSVLVVGGEMCSGRGSPLKQPNKFFVKCTECGKEWEIEPSERSKYQDREMRDEQGRMVGGDCPYCKKKGCVFVMIQCPSCGKYYLSKRITDPKGVASGEVKDTCPHCGTDIVEWYKKHHKKR